MKKNEQGIVRWIAVFMLCIFFGTYGSAWGAEKQPVFDVVTVDATITPPIAEYLLQSIQESSGRSSDGLIILLDTPGGLDSSMREIAKGILNAVTLLEATAPVKLPTRQCPRPG